MSTLQSAEREQAACLKIERPTEASFSGCRASSSGDFLGRPRVSTPDHDRSSTGRSNWRGIFYVFCREPREAMPEEALIWSGVWIGFSLLLRPDFSSGRPATSLKTCGADMFGFARVLKRLHEKRRIS
jgi:hypothetical protein